LAHLIGLSPKSAAASIPWIVSRKTMYASPIAVAERAGDEDTVELARAKLFRHGLTPHSLAGAEELTAQ